MQQRVSRHSWQAPHRRNHPRLLVESAEPVAAISDFSSFTDAGFEVAFCAGPTDADDCPLLRGEDCDLVSGADVVLSCLDPSGGVAAAIVARRPDLPVVVESPRRPDGTLESVPDGCVPLVFPSSVNGQITTVRHAATARRAPRT